MLMFLVFCSLAQVSSSLPSYTYPIFPTLKFNQIELESSKGIFHLLTAPIHCLLHLVTTNVGFELLRTYAERSQWPLPWHANSCKCAPWSLKVLSVHCQNLLPLWSISSVDSCHRGRACVKLKHSVATKLEHSVAMVDRQLNGVALHTHYIICYCRYHRRERKAAPKIYTQWIVCCVFQSASRGASCWSIVPTKSFS